MFSLKNKAFLVIGLMACAACGDVLFDQQDRGTTLFSIQGELLQGQGNIDLTGPVRIAVAWPIRAEEALTRSPLPGYFSQSLEISSTSLPASFEIGMTELPPVRCMREASDGSARLGVGFLLVYEDRDEDGAYTFPQREVHSPDRIINLSELETMVLFQEGPAQPSELAPHPRLHDLFQFDPVTWEKIPLWMPDPREGFEAADYGDVDALPRGFSIITENPAWGQYLTHERAYLRCLTMAQLHDNDKAREDCEMNHSRAPTPTAELEECLLAAQSDEESIASCRASYIKELTELSLVPAYQVQPLDVSVLVPIREDWMAAERFCPPREQDGLPLAIDLQRAVCQADGLAFSVPELPLSEWPSVCYGQASTVGMGIGSAQDAPDWWPCGIP